MTDISVIVACIISRYEPMPHTELLKMLGKNNHAISLIINNLKDTGVIEESSKDVFSINELYKDEIKTLSESILHNNIGC